MRKDTSKIRTREAEVMCVIFKYWLGFFCVLGFGFFPPEQ